MVTMYREQDAKAEVLKGKTIAILGYGSQGHAHANNLKESGFTVIVGEVPGGHNAKKAADAGFEVADAATVVKKADVVVMLLPDELQGGIYRASVGPNLRKGAYLMFAHGFNIHFGQIVPSPDVNVFMVAPKGPGHLVRAQYLKGEGVPALIAIHQDPAGNTKDVALAYAAGIGAARAGVLHTSLRGTRRWWRRGMRRKWRTSSASTSSNSSSTSSTRAESPTCGTPSATRRNTAILPAAPGSSTRRRSRR
jgi:ketol-acid reductoisomerase